MLVRAMHYSIANSWPLLKRVIRDNPMPLMKTSNKELTKILERLMDNSITCWFGLEDNKVHTVILTEVLEDQATGTRNLMIVTISIIEKVSADEYLSMLETLRKYAKGLGCVNVFCYSSNEKLSKLFEEYGADTSYKLIRCKL